MKINIGTLNVRGIKEEQQKELLIKDAIKHDISILSLAETHIPDEEYLLELSEWSIKERRTNSYIIYSVNEKNDKHHGVGLMIKKEFNPYFEKITDRIITATIKLEHRNLKVIAIYARTLKNCEKDPNMRENFYETIDKIINNIAKRDILLLMGDFNAKVGSSNSDYKDCIRKYVKGYMNSSGKTHLEMCIKNELVITNTLFQHKQTHRTTWTAPMRKYKTSDGSERRNPIRNMIDYIITRKNRKRLITNSRSYGRINTDTDHKMVIAVIELAKHKLYRTKQKTEQMINVNGFSNIEN